MQTFAAGLTTDNARWGETALTAYRESLVSLQRALTACEQQAKDAAEGKAADPDRLVATATTTRGAVRDYERALRGLLRTLKIRLEPKGA